MEKHGVYAQTIGINVKTEDFRRHSRQVTLTSPTRNAQVIRSHAEHLMEEMLFGDNGFFAQGHGLRLIGVGCTNLSDGSHMQMDLFSWADTLQKQERERQLRKDEERQKAAQAQQKKDKLDEMMKKVQSRYGKGSISKGTGNVSDQGVS